MLSSVQRSSQVFEVRINLTDLTISLNCDSRTLEQTRWTRRKKTKKSRILTLNLHQQ